LPPASLGGSLAFGVIGILLMGSDGHVTVDEVKAFRRFLDFLPHGKDRLLVILKGHLLIEELLRRIVDERCKKPEALEAVSFECSQIIAIAEALCAKEIDPWVWNSIRKLNSLRNDIAHDLESRRMKDRVSNFISLVRENSPFADEGFGTNEIPVQFEYCLWVVFASLTALLKRPPARFLRLVPRN
jgi:hypothetical protein